MLILVIKTKNCHNFDVITKIIINYSIIIKNKTLLICLVLYTFVMFIKCLFAENARIAQNYCI